MEGFMEGRDLCIPPVHWKGLPSKAVVIEDNTVTIPWRSYQFDNVNCSDEYIQVTYSVQYIQYSKKGKTLS